MPIGLEALSAPARCRPVADGDGSGSASPDCREGCCCGARRYCALQPEHDPTESRERGDMLQCGEHTYSDSLALCQQRVSGKVKNIIML